LLDTPATFSRGSPDKSFDSGGEASACKGCTLGFEPFDGTVADSWLKGEVFREFVNDETFTSAGSTVNLG
jgi:hypothetical protein